MWEKLGGIVPIIFSKNGQTKQESEEGGEGKRASEAK